MKTEILSFEAACLALGKDANLLPDVSMLPEPQQKYLLGLVKLDTITKALNDENQPLEWISDFSNWSQWKYWPAFKRDSAGSGWSYHDFVDWRIRTTAGDRPFRTEELAEFAATHFIDLYNDILNYLYP